MTIQRTALTTACAAVGLLGCATVASADAWLPHPPGAKWQYQWSDTVYNPTGTTENVDVQQPERHELHARLG